MLVQVNKKSHIFKDQATLQAEVKALQIQRTEATTNITPESLKIYTTMRSKKISEPISVLKGSTCTFCGVEDTMAVAQQVRQGQKLVFCTNCERILVYLG
jgi:predicted  nucleic acid-binding Zn-ribbon protein